MKSKLHIRVSFFLMALVSLSTIGYTATKHLCGGKVVLTAVSYTQKDLSCGMKKKKSSCPKHKKASKPCCTNTHELNQLEDNFNHYVVSIDVSNNHGFVVTAISFLPLNFPTKQVVCIPNKSPPDIIFDRSIWYGNMLI